MTFNTITFGCKLNQAESREVSADLYMAGLTLSRTRPDFLILNLCAVTHKAVREGRQKVAELKRKYPASKIISTGCFTESNWPGVDLWVTNKDKDRLADLLIKKFKIKTHQTDDIYIPSKNRALIKIQTGCNNYCAYCIVPFTRGKPQSRKVGDIIKAIKGKELQGFKEVVLTGVNIGLYSSNQVNLAGLLKRVLEETNIQRIRLGSLWPTHITKDLINLYSNNPRLMPHFHLSIQSGSNKVLKLMGRNYTVSHIRKITDDCRKHISYINFTTDIIVGFPGETDKDFRDSVKLIKDIGFSKVHVFKYSKRPGTKAEKFPHQVDEKIKNERSKELINISHRVGERVKKKFSTRKDPNVLWETKKAGYSYGFTDNYIRVKKKI